MFDSLLAIAFTCIVLPNEPVHALINILTLLLYYLYYQFAKKVFRQLTSWELIYERKIYITFLELFLLIKPDIIEIFVLDSLPC
jgi:hypothetical protein